MDNSQSSSQPDPYNSFKNEFLRLFAVVARDSPQVAMSMVKLAGSLLLSPLWLLIVLLTY